MTAPDLPAGLKAALDARLQGLSRNEVAGRAALISKIYRGGGGSGAIASATDALAYALARMPATYAAVTACLNALCEITPDFAPASLLDVGTDGASYPRLNSSKRYVSAPIAFVGVRLPDRPGCNETPVRADHARRSNLVWVTSSRLPHRRPGS